MEDTMPYSRCQNKAYMFTIKTFASLIVNCHFLFITINAIALGKGYNAFVFYG